MLLSSLLNYIALFFEFIGVFLIPRGFLSITSQDIESASSTFVGENVYMARSLIFQKIDGQFCVVFEIRQNHLEKFLKKFATEPKEKFTNEVKEW